MCNRADISPYLIHFTKGNDLNDALGNLLSILSSQKILGSNNMIRGEFNCVCFSESPIESIPQGLINADNYSKYSPFGILVSKEWLFHQGGRPVIYQPVEEYEQLSDNNRWRHVTYNPTCNPPVDFTWEREWRIQTNELHINPEYCSIVVPDRSWVEHLMSLHDEEQDWEIRNYKLIFNDGLLAEMHSEPFLWNVFLLNE